MTATDRWLIAGLGNPGPWFAGTRHNAGFAVVEHLAHHAGTRFHLTGPRHRTTEIDLAAHPTLLAKPLWTINQSGPPIAALLRTQRIAATHLVVIQDDLDFPFGTIRLKRGGGPGGHNGIRSVTEAIASRDYLRMRIGVGRPPKGQKLGSFVLGRFSEAEQQQLPDLLTRCAASLETLLTSGLDHAQTTLHTPQPVS
ncbi:aminoacyl-tRNA hydrolase [Catenulispora yoronensis]|uniref:Peptidyl-tRNA hydrolase n=1 Tax=Catenulispora yoronensis TaxID=450799 RepID=A0ABN2V8K6_9ACTN